MSDTLTRREMLWAGLGFAAAVGLDACASPSDMDSGMDASLATDAGSARDNVPPRDVFTPLDNPAPPDTQAPTDEGVADAQPDVVTPPPPFGPRPFYIVGHNTNTMTQVRAALDAGANALEPDINVYSARPGDLCISHGEGSSSAPTLVDFLTN